MIKAEHVSFEYFRRDENGNVSDMVEAVRDLSLQIRQGEFIGIVGCNGSGKSTFAKLLNALLEPVEGEILIEGMNTHSHADAWNIRKNIGMVFQNPDNQIVGTVVEEDVAFGPENVGVPADEIEKRVTDALEAVGMCAYRMQSPNRLSGGQRQRIAIAGVLAMQPRCIVFDESTAMLDPQGRQEVLQAARMLNREKGITVLFITHNMEEVIEADRVLVMHQGELVAEGTPRDIFAHADEITEYGLELPQIAELAMRLQKNGIPISGTVLDEEELLEELRSCFDRDSDKSIGGSISRSISENTARSPVREHRGKDAARTGLLLDHVSYAYNPQTVYEYPAIRDVSVSLAKGEFAAIIGHTGSGKSTLIQLFNGLLKPDSGHIYFEGNDIYEKGYNRTYLREKIGVVFQYPEYQLFAETVLEDVCFGPKNLKLPLLEVQQRAFEAISAVGLKDDIYDSSPFELSGGQKRRVAIAGVLAMKPDILVLDEPAAGLDPVGKREIFRMLQKLHHQGMTIVLVSHNMEDVAEYAKRVIVLNQGSVDFDGDIQEVFRDVRHLQELGLDVPEVTHVMRRLHAEGYPVDTQLYRMEDVVRELTGRIRSR